MAPQLLCQRQRPAIAAATNPPSVSCSVRRTGSNGVLSVSKIASHEPPRIHARKRPCALGRFSVLVVPPVGVSFRQERKRRVTQRWPSEPIAPRIHNSVTGAHMSPSSTDTTGSLGFRGKKSESVQWLRAAFRNYVIYRALIAKSASEFDWIEQDGETIDKSLNALELEFRWQEANESLIPHPIP